MKECKSCRKEKPLTDYYKGAKNKDGYMTKCKQCFIAINKKNPNTNEYMRKYRSKESVKEKRRAYREENAELIAKKASEYYQKNKLTIKMKRLMKP